MRISDWSSDVCSSDLGAESSCSGARGRPEIYQRRVRTAWNIYMTGHRREVQITNKRGLHERASAKFVTLASGLPCEILVEKDGQSVTGPPTLGLMMLGAAKGANTDTRPCRKGRGRRGI